jgi:tetratricopeptide (TPR) repeat protein
MTGHWSAALGWVLLAGSAWCAEPATKDQPAPTPQSKDGTKEETDAAEDPLANLVGASIVMTDDLTMEGRILREAPDHVVLLVYDGAGRVKIPRSRIKSIEYDFATKSASLAEDDYRGHYELGVWAFHRSMYAEAIQELEKSKGQAGAGPDLLKLLALAQDRTEQFKEAFENYKQYLQAHPEDAEVATRVEELAKTYGVTEPVTAEQPKQPAIPEGLEVSFRWYAETWNNANPCFVSETKDEAGNRSLAVQGQAGAQDKVAFSGTGTNPLDLTNCKEMVCRIYQTGAADARLATAFHNLDGEYFETREQRIPTKEWTTFSIPLTGKNFKSAKTNWNYTAELEGRNGITRIIFLVYGHRELTMYVDSIFFR